MVRRYGLRGKIYPALGVIAWTLGISATVLSGVMKIEAAEIPEKFAAFRPLISSVQGQTWYLVPVLGTVIGIVVVARKQIGEPWVWGAIHHVVNSYRDFVFQEEEQENLHHHRVTLFRHYRWWQYPCAMKGPIGSKLIPVARSGHTTQQSDVAFLAPDDAEKAEGFAGKVWAAFATIMINDLPDLYDDPSDENIAKYAEKTYCTEQWVRSRLAEGRIMARSFCGIAIRVKGREWGVIVIDSRSARAIKRTPEETYDLMGQALSKLLERV